MSCVPSVIKLAYFEYKEDTETNKQSARCIMSKMTITEKSGIISGFTRYVHIVL